MNDHSTIQFENGRLARLVDIRPLTGVTSELLFALTLLHLPHGDVLLLTGITWETLKDDLKLQEALDSLLFGLRVQFVEEPHE
jgi:hypothetical protein